MSTDAEKLGLLQSVLERNIGWISLADEKAGKTFVIATAMLGLLAALTPKFSDWTILSVICFGTAVGLLLLCLIFVALVAFPRLEGPRGSLIFFGGIATMRQDTFLREMSNGITTDLLEDYARQIHRNAEIAVEKYKNLKTASILLFASVLPWLAAIICLYTLIRSEDGPAVVVVSPWD